MAYQHGVLVDQDFALEAVSDKLEQDDTIVWVDFTQPDRAQFDKIGDELGLHELAVDDALEPHQRPKVDYYTSHLFLSCHAVVLDADSADLAEQEVDAFVGKRWLVTVRPDDGFDLEPILDRCYRSPDLVAHGVGFFLYGILDAVIDSYFDALDRLDDFYDEVSDSIFSETAIDPAQQRRSFEMRRALMRLAPSGVPDA